MGEGRGRGWKFAEDMSTNAVKAIEDGMIPVLSLPKAEAEAVYDLPDEDYEEKVEPHHVEIDGKTYTIVFVDSDAVGRESMTPAEVRQHLSLDWDARMLEYKPVWR